MNTEFEIEVADLVKNKIDNIGDRNPVVFYGSSSFRLWTNLQQDFPRLDCLNLAFGGSTIAECDFYYNRLLKQANPSRIFFYAGDNDLGQGVTVQETIDRFKQLFAKIRIDFPEIPFAFLSIKPSPERFALISKIREVNESINNFLQTEEGCAYIDVHSLMMNGENVRTELFCEDQLHMNREGYLLWGHKINSYLF